MTRLTVNELYLNLYDARKIPKGSYWRHIESGDVYEVTGHSIREDDGEPLISYQRWQDSPIMRVVGRADITDIVFSRPLSEWKERFVHVVPTTAFVAASRTR